MTIGAPSLFVQRDTFMLIPLQRANILVGAGEVCGDKRVPLTCFRDFSWLDPGPRVERTVLD